MVFLFLGGYTTVGTDERKVNHVPLESCESPWFKWPLIQPVTHSLFLLSQPAAAVNHLHSWTWQLTNILYMEMAYVWKLSDLQGSSVAHYWVSKCLEDHWWNKVIYQENLRDIWVNTSPGIFFKVYFFFLAAPQVIYFLAQEDQYLRWSQTHNS